MRIEKITQFDKELEFVFIDNEDGSYTSMPKSVYDEQQAAQQLGGNPIG